MDRFILFITLSNKNDKIGNHVFTFVDEALTKFDSDNGATSWSLLRVTTFKESEKIPVCNVACWKECAITSEHFDYNIIFGNESNDCQREDLSKTIHKLCDELPAKGNYLVDVIWIVPSSKELSYLERNIELLGCLMRLTRWHRAKIAIYQYESSTLPLHHTNWTCSLPLHFVNNPFIWDQVVIPNVIWRGGIRIGTSTNTFLWLSGFQLIANFRDDIDFFETDNSHNRDDEAMLHFFDGPIEVVDKIPLSAIPPHSLLPTKLKLALPPCMSLPSTLQNSWEFLSKANSSNKICHILRLGVCSPSSPKRGPLKTTFWKRTIVTERFTAMDDILNWEEIGHRLLILVGDGHNDPEKATVLVLRNSEDYNFLTCRTLAVEDKSSFPDKNESSSSNEGLLDNLPLFTSLDVKYLEEMCKEKQLRCIDKTRETFGNALSSSHLMALAKAVGSKTFRCFSNTKGLLERPYINRHECTPLKRKVDVLKTLHDQENWSEKAYSIQKDMIPDDCTSDQSIRFSGISEVGFLKLDHMLERLHASTEFKQFLEVSQNKPMTSSSQCTSRSLLNSVTQHRHFGRDIYYNNSMEDEVRQQKINQLVSSYISHDTASSSIQKCSEMENVEQGILTPLVIPSDTEKRDNRKLLPCTRPREMKSSNVMVLRNAVKKKVKTKKFVQEELSKLHLKQLRIAVVDALGIHGIHLENPLFKTCAKKLFVICQTFAKDVIGEGRTIEQFQKIATSHVKQVIKFETNLPKRHQRKL